MPLFIRPPVRTIRRTPQNTENGVRTKPVRLARKAAGWKYRPTGMKGIDSNASFWTSVAVARRDASSGASSQAARSCSRRSDFAQPIQPASPLAESGLLIGVRECELA
jgi:hypothetical protein